MSSLSEVDFWGDALTRWPSDVVAKMGVTEEDAKYLINVGLPTGIDWNLSITPPAAGADPDRIAGMPVVALDGPVPLCVDTSAGGVVVAVENDDQRMVNSNIKRLGVFLMLFQDYRIRVRELDEDEAVVLIDEIEQRMRECDPDGMRDGEWYWPVVVEQMRDGFL